MQIQAPKKGQRDFGLARYLAKSKLYDEVFPKMREINIQPWSEEQPPSEMEIRRILDKEALQPYRWSNASGDVYSAHTHPYHKVIYVVQGSITFGFPGDGGQATLHAGDRLELPKGTAHSAVVGSEGVVCLEAHR